MAGQGSPLIALRSTVFDPDHSFGDIDPPFSGSEGYLGLKVVRQGVGSDGHTFYDWVYAFSTAANASYALLDHPHVTVAGNRYNLFPYDGDSTEPHSDLFEPVRTRNSTSLPPPPPADISPPRKRLKKSTPPDNKIVCKICFGIIDGAYSTPCRRCKEATCYECLKTHFETAMKYIDSMPVMCCATVMHHEVARGILPAAEVEKYKQKYDEFNTVDPLYCPVPTCSAFIPPRMFKQTDRKVTCHVCKTAICTKCREIAKDEHVCAEDGSRQFILKTYEYKICPKCGTGVMKIGDGVHSDGGDQEPDSEEEEYGNDASVAGPVPSEVDHSTQVQMQASQDPVFLPSAIETRDETQETTANPTATSESAEVETSQSTEIATDAAETTAQPTVDLIAPEATANTRPENLDDPDEIDWEGVSLDFGDEPTDEAWDTWGCRHQFSEFGKDRIPEFWLVDMNPAGDRSLEVECMGCFNKVKVADGEAKKTGFKEKWCHRVSSRTTEPPTTEAGASSDRRTKKSARNPDTSFECRLCGIIYCGLCKKAARKRISHERVAPDSEPH
ncbi:IBR domain-containing protein [Cladophialophora immunda]|nr:IBR domain-containing protein [Cladophialophora immunda]